MRHPSSPATTPIALLALALTALLILAPSCSMSGADEQNDGEATAEKTADTGAGNEDTADDTGEKDEEESIPVEVVDLSTGPIEELLKSSTNLEAERSVQVFSKASGIIEKLEVEEGDGVREGQVLLRLEDDEQKNRVATVKAELAKARREYDRQKNLHAENLISDQAFNDATYEIERLEIQLDDAERALSYTLVRAPISGTLTARMVNRGQLVNVSEHLFDIVDFESIVARIYVPEKELPSVNVGQEARLRAAALGGRPYEGKVLRIAPTVDARSGTVKVTVAVGGQPGLRPGMFVDVDLVTATVDDALLVPKRALVYDKDRVFVYRIDSEGRAERVFVDPALSDRDHVQPRSGLSVGDRVVIAGQAGLKDGALVEIAHADGPDLHEDEEPEQRASL